MMFVFNWGGYVGNLIVLGNILPEFLVGLFGPHPLLQRRWLLVIAVVAFSPISFYKGVSKLAWASAVAVWALMFLCILVVFRFFIDHHHFAREPTEHAYTFVHSNVLPALGGISFLYTCQDMFFHVFHSLHHPTRKRVAVVAHSIMGGMFVIATVMGICGYLLFFESVSDNILNDFGHDAATQVARALLVMNIIVSVPYTNYIPRVAIMAVVQLYFPDLVVKRPGNKDKRDIFHACVTALLLGTGLLIAENVTNLGLVFELVGGFSAICISLIIPALCHLKLEKEDSRAMRSWCYMLVVLGIVGMCGCVANIIVNL